MGVADHGSDSNTPVHDAIERTKKRGLVAVLIFAAAIVAAVFVLLNAWSSVVELVSDRVNPHREQYLTLANLELGVRLEHFEESFGTAKSVVDPCGDRSSCPDAGRGDLQLYIYATDQATVRALFEGDSLEAYLVTTKEDGFHPPVSWLGWDLGDLGETTVDAMLSVVDQPLEATDTSVRVGPRWASYADVFAYGEPAQYQGLILAYSPAGRAGAFDRESADELTHYQGGDMPEATIASFREGTQPDTCGQFRDDGAVGAWLHDTQRWSNSCSFWERIFEDVPEGSCVWATEFWCSGAHGLIDELGFPYGWSSGSDRKR